MLHKHIFTTVSGGPSAVSQYVSLCTKSWRGNGICLTVLYFKVLILYPSSYSYKDLTWSFRLKYTVIIA